MRVVVAHGRTREHFVPGAEPSPGTINHDRKFFVVGGGPSAIDTICHDIGYLLTEQEFKLLLRLTLRG